MTTALTVAAGSWTAAFAQPPATAKPTAAAQPAPAATQLGSTTHPAATQASTKPAATGPAATSQASTLPGATNLKKVTVSAELDKNRDQIAPSLGAVTYTIGQNQIQSTPEGDNAPLNQVLLRAPGVVLDSYGQEHVRGEHGNLTYRVNGVLLPEGLNGFGQEVDTHVIQSVTLIDGTLPAQFGFRTAGIVDIQTKSGASLDYNALSIYGGSYGTVDSSAQVGGTSGNLDYFVSTTYNIDDLGIENPTGSGHPIHDDTEQGKAFAYLSDRLTDTSRLSLLLNASDADFQIPNVPGLTPQYTLQGAPPGDSAKTNENQNEQKYYVVLAYQNTIDDLSYQIAPYVDYGEIYFTPDVDNDLIFQGLAGEVRNSFLTNGIQFDASYVANDNHTIRGGFLAQYTNETLNTDTYVFPVNPITGQQSSDVPSSVVADSGNWGMNEGQYIQDEWQINRHFTLNYGARFDFFDSSFVHGYQLSPRVNLVWKINDSATAHGGYSRYFVPPEVQNLPPSVVNRFTNTTGAPGNTMDTPSHPETSDYYDAGIQHKFTPEWQVTLDGYYKQAHNLIDNGQFGDAVILSDYTYRTAMIQGLELSTTYATGGFSWFGNLSYVYTRANDINSAQYEFSDAELAYIKTHYIELDHDGEYGATTGITYTWKDNRAYADFVYGDGLRSGFANTAREPNYFPLNVGYEHTFHPTWGSKGIKARVDILNVFDEVYQLRSGTGLGINAPQYGERRGFFAGVTYEF